MDDTQYLDCTQALPDDPEDDDTADKEPTIVAWLEIGGTRHDIYEGETKIGRDPDTCKVVLESKALSKQHAAIEAGRDIHTIADLGSMNKTRIGRLVLKPNVQYALHGGEKLRFGDVNALYTVKPASHDMDSGSETDSESMLLHNSDELLTTPDLKGIIPPTPAAPRDRLESGMTFIPESPMSESTPIKSPGDALQARKLDASKEDSFFFEPSQSKRASTSFGPSGSARAANTTGEGYNSDASTDIDDDGDNQATQVFDPMTDDRTGASKDSNNRGGRNSDANQNENGGLDGASRVNPDEEKEGSTGGGKGRRSKGTPSKVRFKSIDLDDEEEKGWSSDASTDIEEIFDKATKLPGNVDLEVTTSSANVSYEDCTQDVMAAFGIKGKKAGEKSNKADESHNESIDMLPTQPFIAYKSPPRNKKQEPDLEAPTQVFGENEKDMLFRKPLAMAPKSKRKSKGLDEDFLNAPTQVFHTDASPDDINNAPTQPFSKEDILDKPTQEFSMESVDDISNDPTQPFSKGAGTLNLDAPTQLFTPDSKDSSFEEGNTPTVLFKDIKMNLADQAKRGKALAEAFSDSDDDVEDIFNQLTQPFQPNNSIVKDSTPKLKQAKDTDDSDDDVDIFNLPTQPFQSNSFVKDSKPTADKTTDELSDSDDDVTNIFDQTTQVFTPSNKSHVDMDATTQMLKDDKCTDLDLDAPTQILDSEVIAQTGTKTKSGVQLDYKDTSVEYEDDDQLPPTQVFTPGSPKKDTPSPRSRLSSQETDSMAPTQPFKDPNETSSIGERSILRDKPSSIDDDYDDNAPTQILEDDLFNAPTQPFNLTADKSNLEAAGKGILKSPSPGSSGGPSKSIVQLWDGLDNVATLDYNIPVNDGVAESEKSMVAVSKSVSPVKKAQTVQGNEGEKHSDSASDVSETLLGNRDLEDEETDLLPDVDVSVIKTPIDNANIEEENAGDDVETENYNSDESTDMEDEPSLLPNENIDTPKASKSSLESYIPEQSCDSGIDGSKDSLLTSVGLLKKSVTLDSLSRLSSKINRGRLSNLNPVATSSPASQAMLSSEGSQDSPALTEYSESNINSNISDNDGNDVNMKRRCRGKRRKMNLVISSDSESELEVSQVLFDMSPCSTKSLELRTRSRRGYTSLVEEQSASSNQEGEGLVEAGDNCANKKVASQDVFKSPSKLARWQGKNEDMNDNKDGADKHKEATRSAKSIPESSEPGEENGEAGSLSASGSRKTRGTRASTEITDTPQRKSGRKSSEKPADNNSTPKCKSKRRIDYDAMLNTSSDHDSSFSGFGLSPTKIARSEIASDDNQPDCNVSDTSRNSMNISKTKTPRKISDVLELDAEEGSDQIKNVEQDGKGVTAGSEDSLHDEVPSKASIDSPKPTPKRGRRSRVSKTTEESEPSVSGAQTAEACSSVPQRGRRGRRGNKAADEDMNEPEDVSPSSPKPTSPAKSTSPPAKGSRSPAKPTSPTRTSSPAKFSSPPARRSRSSVKPTSPPARASRSPAKPTSPSPAKPSSSEKRGSSPPAKNSTSPAKPSSPPPPKGSSAKTSSSPARPSSSPHSSPRRHLTSPRAATSPPASPAKLSSPKPSSSSSLSTPSKPSSPKPVSPPPKPIPVAQPQSPQPKQGRQKRASRKTSAANVTSEIESTEQEDSSSVTVEDTGEEAEVGKKNRRGGKQIKAVLEAQEKVKVGRRIIKTEPIDEEVNDVQQSETAIVHEEVEIKVEKTNERATGGRARGKRKTKEATSMQEETEVNINISVKVVGVRVRSRRTSKEPHRFSPDREVKPKRTRGKKADTTIVKEEPLDTTVTKRTRGFAKGAPIADPTPGPSRKSSRFSKRQVVKTEPLSEGDDCDTISQASTSTIETVSSVTTLDTESGTLTMDDESSSEMVNPQKRRGRSRKNSLPTMLSKPAQSQRGKVDLSATIGPLSSVPKAPRKTRGNTTLIHIDTQATKRARLDTVYENLQSDENEAASTSMKTQGRNQRGKRAQIKIEPGINDTKNKSGQKATKNKESSMQESQPTRGKSSRKSSIKETSSEADSQSSDDLGGGRRALKRQSGDETSEAEPVTPKTIRRSKSRRGSPIPEDQLTSPSQRQQRANNKPRVLFTGYKDLKDEKIVTDLGGFLVDSPRACSVLVTTRVGRTFKLLSVIGKGQPIVSPDWLTACRTARCFVDPWQYLVEDRHAEEEYGFNLEQSLQSASKVSLFEGLAIHATPAVKPPPHQMKEIIECSGGQYLDQPPRRFGPQIMIVSCPEDQVEWPIFRNLGIPILGTEFVLTGLLRHELLLDEFLV